MVFRDRKIAASLKRVSPWTVASRSVHRSGFRDRKIAASLKLR